MSKLIAIIEKIGKKKAITILTIVVLVGFVPLLSHIVAHYGEDKYSFSFYLTDVKSYNSCSVQKEQRWLPACDTLEMSIAQYTRELLLGSMNRNRDSFFSRETVVRSVFLRNECLYIDLSFPNSLENMAEDHCFFRKYLLFEKNIFTNFTKLAKIYVYIDGFSVYESYSPITEDAVDAALDKVLR